MSAFMTVFPAMTYTLENGTYILRTNDIPTTFQPITKKRKIVDPFDPEATVPMPNELDDQNGPHCSSVWRRNEKERQRVKEVNEAYESLRMHLPLDDGEKRISKVDTLRFAIRYIRHLGHLLENSLHQNCCKCFAGFQEESEGNIQLNFHSIMNRHNFQ